MIDALICDDKDNDTTSAAELAAAAALALGRVVVQGVEKKEANNCDGNDDDIQIRPQDKQGNSITMIDAIICDDKDNDTTLAAAK